MPHPLAHEGGSMVEMALGVQVDDSLFFPFFEYKTISYAIEQQLSRDSGVLPTVPGPRSEATAFGRNVSSAPPKTVRRRPESTFKPARQADFGAPHPEIDPRHPQLGHHDASGIPYTIALPPVPAPPAARPSFCVSDARRGRAGKAISGEPGPEMRIRRLMRPGPGGERPSPEPTLAAFVPTPGPRTRGGPGMAPPPAGGRPVFNRRRRAGRSRSGGRDRGPTRPSIRRRG